MPVKTRVQASRQRSKASKQPRPEAQTFGQLETTPTSRQSQSSQSDKASSVTRTTLPPPLITPGEAPQAHHHSLGTGSNDKGGNRTDINAEELSDRPAYNTRRSQKRGLSLSENGDQTCRSTPCHSDEELPAENWDFNGDDETNDSIPSLSSTRSDADVLPDTLPIPADAGFELGSASVIQQPQPVDFSETASTIRRSSPCGQTPQQNWALGDTSSVAWRSDAFGEYNNESPKPAHPSLVHHLVKPVPNHPLTSPASQKMTCSETGDPGMNPPLVPARDLTLQTSIDKKEIQSLLATETSQHFREKATHATRSSKRQRGRLLDELLANGSPATEPDIYAMPIGSDEDAPESPLEENPATSNRAQNARKRKQRAKTPLRFDEETQEISESYPPKKKATLRRPFPLTIESQTSHPQTLESVNSVKPTKKAASQPRRARRAPKPANDTKVSPPSDFVEGENEQAENTGFGVLSRINSNFHVEHSPPDSLALPEIETTPKAPVGKEFSSEPLLQNSKPQKPQLTKDSDNKNEVHTTQSAANTAPNNEASHTENPECIMVSSDIDDDMSSSNSVSSLQEEPKLLQEETEETLKHESSKRHKSSRLELEKPQHVDHPPTTRQQVNHHQTRGIESVVIEKAAVTVSEITSTHHLDNGNQQEQVQFPSRQSQARMKHVSPILREGPRTQNQKPFKPQKKLVQFMQQRKPQPSRTFSVSEQGSPIPLGLNANSRLLPKIKQLGLQSSELGHLPSLDRIRAMSQRGDPSAGPSIVPVISKQATDTKATIEETWSSTSGSKANTSNMDFGLPQEIHRPRHPGPPEIDVERASDLRSQIFASFRRLNTVIPESETRSTPTATTCETLKRPPRPLAESEPTVAQELHQMIEKTVTYLEKREAIIRHMPITYRAAGAECVEKIRRRFIKEHQALTNLSKHDAKRFTLKIQDSYDMIEKSKMRRLDIITKLEGVVLERKTSYDQVNDRLRVFHGQLLNANVSRSQVSLH